MRPSEANTEFRLFVRPVPGTRDSFGAPVEGTPVEYGRVWGKLDSQSPRELLRDGRRVDEFTHVVTIWTPTTTLKTNDYLVTVEGSRTFTVTSPPMNPGGKNAELVLTCREEVGR